MEPFFRVAKYGPPGSVAPHWQRDWPTRLVLPDEAHLGSAQLATNSGRRRNRMVFVRDDHVHSISTRLASGEQSRFTQGVTAMPEVVRHRNMAVFIDLENLFGGYGGDVLGVPMSRLIRGIREEVTSLGISTGSATTRAYANWSHPGMSTYRREMVENGVEPVQVWSHAGPARDPGEGRKKNAADIQLVVDALTVAGEAPWIDVFAVVSGDGDFIPLIRRLQFLGKIVVGVSIRQAGVGGVSKDLRAAVDHFIDLMVGDELSTTAMAVPVATATGAQGRIVARQAAHVVPSNKKPSREEYIETTLKFARDYPQTTKNGDVDGASMNGLLRRQWPRVTYSDFGYRSFGAFIQEGCGLSIFHPNIPQRTQVRVDDSMHAPDQAEVLDRAGFLSAVQALLQDGSDLSDEIQRKGTAGFAVEDLDLEIQRLTGNQRADVGFPGVLPLLRFALSGSSQVVIGDGTGQRVVHRDAVDGREPYPPLDETSILRAVLEEVSPQVTYPSLDALADVLNELTLQILPLAPEELLDLVGNQLPGVSAEQIRHAFSLLFTIGAFLEDEADGTITLSADINSTDDGVNLVLQDAKRRAETIGWDLKEESVRQALFPTD